MSFCSNLQYKKVEVLLKPHRKVFLAFLGGGWGVGEGGCIILNKFSILQLMANLAVLLIFAINIYILTEKNMHDLKDGLKIP